MLIFYDYELLFDNLFQTALCVSTNIFQFLLFVFTPLKNLIFLIFFCTIVYTSSTYQRVDEDLEQF